MLSRLMFSTIFMLSIIASTAILDSSDSTWLTEEDDTLFSSADLTLNPTAPISFNQPLSSSDLDASLFGSASLPASFLSFSTTNNEIDTSDALLWNLDSSSILPSSGETDESNESNLFLDDSIQLADCSTSFEESLPTIDNTLSKPRLRQRDSSNKCTNFDETPHMSSESPSADEVDNLIQEMFKDSELSRLLTQAMENPNHNSLCYILSNRELPWGICSSGQERDQVPLGGQIIINDSPYTLWSLRHAINAPSMVLSCPISPPQVLHCCRGYLLGNAQGCVLLRDLYYSLF